MIGRLGHRETRARHGRIERVRLSVALCFALITAFAPPAHAQAMPPSALDATDARQSSHKSPATAALIAAAFAGGGHWYAQENTRGWIVAIITITGVAITMGGRTDTVGKIAGVAAVGGWTFGVVDGALAAKRYNARHGSRLALNAPAWASHGPRVMNAQ